MKEEILKLREQGKTYKEITELLKCSKGLVSYYCKGYSLEPYESTTRICLNCNAEIKKAGKKYCSSKCKGLHTSYVKYVEYLGNQESYNGYKTKMGWIKQHILKEQNYCCNICTMKNIWNNKPLIFVLDHIDGNACNNIRKNLRLVCHNCDSQLDTYKSKNIGKSTRKYKPHIM